MRSTCEVSLEIDSVLRRASGRNPALDRNKVLSSSAALHTAFVTGKLLDLEIRAIDGCLPVNAALPAHRW